MSAIAKHQKNLLNAVYAVDGIIVVNGIEGQAISSPDPDQPLKVKGRELAKFNLDLVSLLKQEMIVPVTDQLLVHEAMKYFEEETEEEENELEKGSGNTAARKRGVRRRVRRRSVSVNG